MFIRSSAVWDMTCSPGKGAYNNIHYIIIIINVIIVVVIIMIINIIMIMITCAEAQGGVEASWVDLFVHAERNQRGTFDIGADDDADDDDDDDDGGDGDGETF